jgi:hypothetical protein
MAENRGRPSEKPSVALDNWIQETENQIWHFDRTKSANGCWKVENKFKAGEKQPKPKIEQRTYVSNMPTVVVFNTSNRSNAKTKMKVINKNIDYVLSSKKIPGIPEIAEWLEIGVGKSFIGKYKQKYNLT